MNIAKTLSVKSSRGESGITLIETVVALAILAIIVVAIMGGLYISQKATILAHQISTAESLAQGQMEYVKKAQYVSAPIAYTPSALPTGPEYSGYSASISAVPVHLVDDGIQKITVIVERDGQQLVALCGYKEDR